MNQLVTNVRIQKKQIMKIGFFNELKSNKYMYLLALPGILFFFIFSYLPMFGILIAFEDFNPIKGIFGSELVGLKNFEFFFTSLDWMPVTINTLYLNTLFIATGLIVSVIIAIMLSEINNRYFIKISQSIIILPNFISWTVVSMFCLALFSSDNGYINSVLKSLGAQPVLFNQNAGIWPLILVLIRLWKGAGFNSIIFLATIVGIDIQQYESAKIDGAKKLQCIYYITLPMLRNTVILMALLGVGGIFYGDFGMIYAIVGDNSLLYPTTDVIDTFVYRALRQLGDMGMASAVGLYQSLVGFILVVATNKLAKKYDKDAALF